ncbi:unnamed protein product [Darwinula stevensoni]|uniref:cyclin-dependent kinase n=1 Tax=Darwinula stevensoni TaxID=69355 RepID=A0A7R8XBM8_9CRUS|nr:unnamed protein product [Darwinula stevensoni]CAG0892951.1 unnamed protein product [Darwinula stevensoni]
MDKYDKLGVIGEGSYGIVLKCRHRDTGQLVAIKKFLDSEEDKLVRKIALREIKMLKRLEHENLVNVLEVFRRRKRLHLVLEYVDHTILEELENQPHGIPPNSVREYSWQILRALAYCHAQRVIHRDVKPENVLVSKSGVLKLCDFGFARLFPKPGESCTEYVATRWYRGPELLVGDTKYGPEVDVWAVGCLFAEMTTGEPLFPGESDIDQLFLIVQALGRVCERHQDLLRGNPAFLGLKMRPGAKDSSLESLLPGMEVTSFRFLKACLTMDPSARPLCDALVHHAYFTRDGFPEQFLPVLKQKLAHEFLSNPLLKKSRRSGDGSRKWHGLGLMSRSGSGSKPSSALQLPQAHHIHDQELTARLGRRIVKGSPYLESVKKQLPQPWRNPGLPSHLPALTRRSLNKKRPTLVPTVSSVSTIESLSPKSSKSNSPTSPARSGKGGGKDKENLPAIPFL